LRRFSQQLVLFLLVSGQLAACGSSSSGDDATWNGKTYLLDSSKIPKGAWTKPKGVGSELGGFVPQFLIGVDSNAANVTITTAQNGVQDKCTVTATVPLAGAHPDSTISVPVFKAHISGVDNKQQPRSAMATIRNLSLINILPGSTNDGELDAILDMSDLVPLFYLIDNPDKDTVCASLKDFGAACATCEASGQPYCEQLHAVQISASAKSATISPVSDTDIPSSCL
jgi:hypothetical protein